MTGVWERVKAESGASFASTEREDRVRREVERMADAMYSPRAYEEQVLIQSRSLIQLDQYATGCVQDARYATDAQRLQHAAAGISDVLAWAADTLYRPTVLHGIDRERFTVEQDEYRFELDDDLARAWDAATLKRRNETGENVYNNDRELIRAKAPDQGNVIDDAFTVLRGCPRLNDRFQSTVATLQRWLHDYDDQTTTGFH